MAYLINYKLNILPCGTGFGVAARGRPCTLQYSNWALSSGVNARGAGDGESHWERDGDAGGGGGNTGILSSLFSVPHLKILYQKL